MAGFKLEGFMGLRPRLSSRLLSAGEATVASNVRLGSGDIEPWRTPLAAGSTSLTSPITLYYYENGGSPLWLEWATDVDVARSPVEADTLDRVYYTGAPDDPDAPSGPARPKMTWSPIAGLGGGLTYPRSWRYVGIPAPPAAPVAATAGIRTPTVTATGLTTNKMLMTVTYPPYLSVGGGNSIPTFKTQWATIPPQWTASSTVIVELSGLVEGDELEVASVVDENTVTVRNFDRSGSFAASSVVTQPTWRRGLSASVTLHVSESVEFAVPDGARLTVPGHSLTTGMILRVTKALDSAQLFMDLGEYLHDAEPWPEPRYLSVPDRDLVLRPKHKLRPVWYNSTDGFTPFSLGGSWTFEVRRGSSNVDTVESRAYVYTYVSTLNEEGPPSPPSNIIEAYDGDPVVVSNLVTPGGDYEPYIDRVRVYRTSTGVDSTDYFYVGEKPAVPDTEMTESVRTVLLGDPLKTLAYDPPPDDMRGVVTLPNGCLAGFSGNTVWMSEPYAPHAWPYKKQVDANIVGLAVFSTSLLVLTDRTPYVMSGAHPRSTAVRQIDFEQPCVSKRSIAVLGDNVVYASPDGLVSVGASGAGIITEEYLTKREWAEYDPTTLVGAVLDGAYYGFSLNGKSFVFDPMDPRIGFSDLVIGGSDLLYEPLQDALFFVLGTTIFKWDGTDGSHLPLTWRSRALRTEPLNLSCGRIVADSYPVTMRLYAHNNLVTERVITSDEMFRLPSGYLATEYQVEVTGTSRVRLIHLSDSVAELADD